jgi:hypothetical protein
LIVRKKRGRGREDKEESRKKGRILLSFVS